jgi:transposase
VSELYSGRQFVGIDLHRRRSVVLRMTAEGDPLDCVRISNDVEMLSTVMARAGEAPEVVLEATYGWYWAVDALRDLGAHVHLAHPLGVKAFEYRRVKNDLLTELPDRSFERCARCSAVLARFRPRDQRRGRAAGVLRVGGAAARLA